MPKRIAPLSEMQVKKAKSREKDYKISDGLGLFLLITSTGGKLWRMNYRYESKQKTLALGIYPEVSLADVRKRRDIARQALANGIDPGETKRLCRQAGTGENTFEAVAREWHGKFAKTWVPRHAENKLARLEQNVFPWIGTRPVQEIAAADVLSVLRPFRGAWNIGYSAQGASGVWTGAALCRGHRPSRTRCDHGPARSTAAESCYAPGSPHGPCDSCASTSRDRWV
jgi:hypothetical protein